MHPVERKLAVEILPYIESAKELSRFPMYRVHAVYVFTHDLLAALAGFGITHPLLAAMSGNPTSALSSTLPILGPYALPLGITALSLWAIVKTVVTRNDGEKRATLAGSCRREFRAIEARMLRELAKDDPMPGIRALQQEIEAIHDRHIAEGSWPWSGPAPGVAARVAARLDDLRTQFGSGWGSVPTVQQAA